MTVIVDQVQEHAKEGGIRKERMKQPVQNIQKDERKVLEECSEKDQQKLPEGNLQELPNQSEADLAAQKAVKNDEYLDVCEEKVKVLDKDDGSLEASNEPDECSGQEQPMPSQEGTIKEISNHREEDLEALKSAKDEGKSVVGKEKVKTMDKADGSLEESKDPKDCSGSEQSKLSKEVTSDESPNQSEKDLEMLKSVKSEGKSVVREEHQKLMDKADGSSEKTQKRSVVEAGITVDAKSIKKHKIPTTESDHKCIVTNSNMQKNDDQAGSSALVDDLAVKKFDTFEKMHPNAQPKDMKQSVTLGKTKDDISRYLTSLETGELVSLCTKLCAADNKLFRVLSKPE